MDSPTIFLNIISRANSQTTETIIAVINVTSGGKPNFSPT